MIYKEKNILYPMSLESLTHGDWLRVKDGSRDVADFWMISQGRFLYIRYFALRDHGGNYKGTLEANQDVAGIKGLEGERRLLDWED